MSDDDDDDDDDGAAGAPFSPWLWLWCVCQVAMGGTLIFHWMNIFWIYFQDDYKDHDDRDTCMMMMMARQGPHFPRGSDYDVCAKAIGSK